MGEEDLKVTFPVVDLLDKIDKRLERIEASLVEAASKAELAKLDARVLEAASRRELVKLTERVEKLEEADAARSLEEQHEAKRKGNQREWAKWLPSTVAALVLAAVEIVQLLH